MRPAPPRVVRFTVTPPARPLSACDDSDPMSPSRLTARASPTSAPSAEQIVVRALDQLEPRAAGLGRAGRPLLLPRRAMDRLLRWNECAEEGGRDRRDRRDHQPDRPAVPAGRAGAPTTPSFLRRTTRRRVCCGFRPPGASRSVDDAEPGPGRAEHYWPEVLPGGQAVLFTIPTHWRSERADCRARSDDGRAEDPGPGGSHARYVPTGHIVYGVEGTLRAVAFDLRRLEVVGTRCRCWST